MEALLSTCRNAEPKLISGVKPEPQFIFKWYRGAALGIVVEVSTALAAWGANLVETAQFRDHRATVSFRT